MKSFDPKYIQKLVVPHRLITIIRQIGEYKGKQELYRQQAPEMLENLRHVAMIQRRGRGVASTFFIKYAGIQNQVVTSKHEQESPRRYAA